MKSLQIGTKCSPGLEMLEVVAFCIIIRPLIPKSNISRFKNTFELTSGDEGGGGGGGSDARCSGGGQKEERAEEAGGSEGVSARS